ncbi:transcriptional regulator [Mycoplasmatota bacterium WC44]
MTIKLTEIIEKLNGEIFTNHDFDLKREVEYVFSCDLMSDVLMFTRNASEVEGRNIILTTGLATNQSLRTAEMLDVDVVCLVRGKRPSDKMIKLAEESNIILIGTKCSTFTSNGLLFQEGLKGIEGYLTDEVQD